MEKDRLLDFTVVADKLDVSLPTVYRLKNAGILTAVRTGVRRGYKVRQSVLDEYLYRRDNDLLI